MIVPPSKQLHLQIYPSSFSIKFGNLIAFHYHIFFSFFNMTIFVLDVLFMDLQHCISMVSATQTFCLEKILSPFASHLLPIRILYSSTSLSSLSATYSSLPFLLKNTFSFSPHFFPPATLLRLSSASVLFSLEFFTGEFNKNKLKPQNNSNSWYWKVLGKLAVVFSRSKSSSNALSSQWLSIPAFHSWHVFVRPLSNSFSLFGD